LQHGFLDKYSDIESFIHRLDPRTKLLCLVAFVVVVVSTPPNKHVNFAAYAVVLLAVSLLSRIPLGYILKRSCLIIPFGLLAAACLPFWDPTGSGHSNDLRVLGLGLSRHGLSVLWNVLIKSWLAVVAMTLLSSSTRFPALLKALTRLHVPNVPVVILSFMYRYVFVVADEAMRMQRAWKSRYLGGNNLRQIPSAGNLIGLLFIRAYERAERIFQSMTSRGFDGRVRTLNQLRLSTSDVLFAVPFVGIVMVIRLWDFA
jgi:cobalt/nickel transport system permease protein